MASRFTDYERRTLNHPTLVWRKWTAVTRVKKTKKLKVPAPNHDIEQLRARITEVSLARPPFPNAGVCRMHGTRLPKSHGKIQIAFPEISAFVFSGLRIQSLYGKPSQTRV